MNGITIAETYTLPSLGKVYQTQINPEIQLRSMTTEDEMLRLTPSEKPYKVLCDVIDGCIIGEKPAISVYDMCLPDYQFLLHKLRVVTYGNEYPIQSVCPYCGAVNKKTIDLDKMEVKEYTNELDKYLKFQLPVSKHKIEIKLQTPRMSDDILLRAKEFKKKHTDAPDPTLLYTLSSMITKVDDTVYDSIKIDTFVRKLSMADTNYILKCAEKLNTMIGLNMAIDVHCKECGDDYVTQFRINQEFFGPRIDI